MCLIIASKLGEPVPTDELDDIWGSNSDGFGVAYLTGKGRVCIVKTLHKGKVERMLKEVEGRPYVAHWRYATHGSKGIENVHPFEVVKGGLAMVHNGIINIEIKNKKRSDTAHFVDVLKTAGVERVCEKTQEELGRIVGSNNKLAFLDARGVVSIVNEKAGTWEGGRWYSNTYWRWGSGSGWGGHLVEVGKGKWKWEYSYGDAIELEEGEEKECPLCSQELDEDAMEIVGEMVCKGCAEELFWQPQADGV